MAGGGTLDWLPVQHVEPASLLALLIASRDEPGTLYRVSEVIYRHRANISYIATSAVGSGWRWAVTARPSKITSASGRE